MHGGLVGGSGAVVYPARVAIQSGVALGGLSFVSDICKHASSTNNLVRM